MYICVHTYIFIFICSYIYINNNIIDVIFPLFIIFHSLTIYVNVRKKRRGGAGEAPEDYTKPNRLYKWVFNIIC